MLAGRVRNRYTRFVVSITSTSINKLQWWRRGESNGTGLAALRIFMPAAAFAARTTARSRWRPVCGLDYPFTLSRRSGA